MLGLLLRDVQGISARQPGYPPKKPETLPAKGRYTLVRFLDLYKDCFLHHRRREGHRESRLRLPTYRTSVGQRSWRVRLLEAHVRSSR